MRAISRNQAIRRAIRGMEKDEKGQWNRDTEWTMELPDGFALPDGYTRAKKPCAKCRFCLLGIEGGQWCLQPLTPKERRAVKKRYPCDPSFELEIILRCDQYGTCPKWRRRQL